MHYRARESQAGRALSGRGSLGAHIHGGLEEASEEVVIEGTLEAYRVEDL